MSLKPKYIKFRKSHLRFPSYKDNRNHIMRFGTYGLKSLQSGYLTSEQIETVKRALLKRLKNVHKLTRNKKKFARVWSRVFPDVPLTSIGTESRIGKGKGNVELWVSPVQRGQILFEFNLISDVSLKSLFVYISARLPVQVKLVCINELK